MYGPAGGWAMKAPEHPGSVLNIDWSSSGTDGPESLLTAHFLLLPDYLSPAFYHIFPWHDTLTEWMCWGSGFRLQHGSIADDFVLSLNRYLLDDEKQDDLSACPASMVDKQISNLWPSTVILKTPSCPMPEARCSTPLHPSSSQSVAMFEELSHTLL